MANREDIRLALHNYDHSGTITLAPSRLCDFGIDRLEMQGVGVALISSTESRSLLAASGELAGTVEELQFSLGEGPCLDAWAGITPMTEGHLATVGASRWPAFAPAAVTAGIQAVFAFPLSVGAACFGVLDLARSKPGMLDDEEMDDALALADIATETVLAIQADSRDDVVADELGGVGSERIVVHQATGMVAAQADVDVAGALAILRAHAFATEETLREVAHHVIVRRLTFEPS